MTSDDGGWQGISGPIKWACLAQTHGLDGRLV
jgi:hypothetical protein